MTNAATSKIIICVQFDKIKPRSRHLKTCRDDISSEKIKQKMRDQEPLEDSNFHRKD